MLLKLRRITAVLTAALTLAAASIPTNVEAQGWGGGGWDNAGWGGCGCCCRPPPPPPPPCCCCGGYGYGGGGYGYGGGGYGGW
jgi:hypothetical protein